MVSVDGRHAERFLHSQLTSDVKNLASGACQQTAMLDRGGRLRAFGILCRRRQGFALLLPSDAGPAAVDRLQSFLIADDVQIAPPEAVDLRVALGAEAVRQFAEAAGERTFAVELLGSRGFITWQEETDLPSIDPEEFEARRVLTGFPRWGAEAAEGMLVHQTTLLETAVSQTKGCYLGQETVAKVVSGRGAARAPMLLEVVAGADDGEALVGREFSSEGEKKGGTVLSTACWNGSVFIQALVARSLRVADREIECIFAAGPRLTVRVHDLPFLAVPDPEGWARRIELRAVAAFADDREDEAIALYRRAIAVCPWYADAYEGLGVILGRHGRFGEAIDLMRRLLEVDAESVMAHTNLSLYYNQLGRIEDAEREAAEALRAKMHLERQERDLAEAKKQKAESEAADRERRAEMFRQVLELDRDDALGNFGLGELLLEQGKFDQAVVHLERALASDPRYSAALLALGRAYEGAENLSAAGATYRRGVEVAAAKGDLATANRIQERLAVLEGDPSGS